MEQKFFQILTSIGLCFLLAGCSTGPEICEFRTEGVTLAPKKATSRPYKALGAWYYPQPYYEYEEEGLASFYGGGDVFHGRRTATGERFDMNGITAAHKTVPLPCIAKVTNLENGRELIVKVNDRGPFPPGRIIDVSRRSAQLLGFEGKGLARVRVTTLVPESLALNGIDPSTVMVAQAAPAPAVGVVAPLAAVPIAATALAAPETLFDAIGGPSSEEEVQPHPTSIMVTKPCMRAEAPPPESIVIAEAAPMPVVEKQPSQLPIKLGPSVSTGIFVYVGEFESLAKAQATARSLEGFIDIPSVTVKNNGPRPYAASLGPLLSMSQANEVLDQLVNAGHLLSRIVIQH